MDRKPSAWIGMQAGEAQAREGGRATGGHTSNVISRTPFAFTPFLSLPLSLSLSFSVTVSHRVSSSCCPFSSISHSLALEESQ